MAEINIDLTNDKFVPTRGLKWINSLSYRAGNSGNTKYSFTKLASAASFYYKPNFPFDLVFALRVGGEVNVGDFPFYHSATLGGGTNLRGYRRSRFSGESSFYQNLEMRFKIAKIKSYILSGQWGGYGFVDNGRVWANEEVSKEWHSAIGGGLWLNFYDLFLVSGGVGVSNEGALARVNGGFFF